MIPSLSDCLFIALMAVLFASGTGWSELLGDGDTGMHVRTGDYILATHSVPVRDLYSASAPNGQWFAWEWLADVIFAMVHRWAGMKGLALFSGTLICAALIILFRHMIWRRTAWPIAVLVTIIVADALRFHYLARPHILTMILTAITLWMLDRDWSEPGNAAWALVGLSALWANLHGGFIVMLIALGSLTLSALWARDRQRAQRYGMLTAACSAATLVNPYGWQLHLHIIKYLRADWIISQIDEFQSPTFRSEGMLKFEILLFAGLIVIAALIRSGRQREALPILFWAHAALTSARHVTIYAVTAAPVIAHQLNCLWDRWIRSSKPASFVGAVSDIVGEFQPHASRTSLCVPVFIAILAVSEFGGPWPRGFPSSLFPTAIVGRNMALLTGPGHEKEPILNPDHWGGYLLYTFYPGRRVFFDGRSDFYGSAMIGHYLSLRSASGNWEELVKRYRFHFALIPPTWALAQALKHSPEWVVRDQDKQAILFERRYAAPLPGAAN